MNGSLQTLESKALKIAPTREVIARILQVLDEGLADEGFAIKNCSNFNEKKPFKDLHLDLKKVQSKYVNIKIIIIFFYQGFLSQTLTTHRTAGEGRGSSYSTLPLPPTHEHSDIYLQLCT